MFFLPMLPLKSLEHASKNKKCKCGFIQDSGGIRDFIKRLGFLKKKMQWSQKSLNFEKKISQKLI